MDHIPLLPGSLSLSLALVSILEHFILELKTVYPGSIYRVILFLYNFGQHTKDQNQGLVRDVRALLRNCIFGITPERDGM